MPCSFEFEDRLLAAGISPTAGIDEAGRGPLAGPVVAAAVILPRDFPTHGMDDSKRLSTRQRRDAFERLTKTQGVHWSVALRDNNSIDRLNILRATHEAMREAVLGLRERPVHALIDGLPVPDFPLPSTAVVGGDAKCFSIAAASIIAKVIRDDVMEKMDAAYPEYGFRQHKGYGTKAHLEALRKHGPSPVHRRSFAPVANSEGA